MACFNVESNGSAISAQFSMMPQTYTGPSCFRLIPVSCARPLLAVPHMLSPTHLLQLSIGAGRTQGGTCKTSTTSWRSSCLHVNVQATSYEEVWQRNGFPLGGTRLGVPRGCLHTRFMAGNGSMMVALVGSSYCERLIL